MKQFFTQKSKWKRPPIRALGLFFLCLLFCNFLFSQEATPTIDAETPEKFKPQFGVGISSGLHAIIGADIAVTIAPSLGVRVGYNHLSAERNGYETSLSSLGLGSSNEPFVLDADANLNTLQLWLEWMPGESRLLRIQAGLAYALDNQITVTGEYEGSYTFNDLVVPSENIGTVTGVYTANKIFPYLGLGFGHAVPEKRVTFSMEVGVFYRGEPTIEIIGTELFEPNSTNGNAEIISSNASKYKFHPVVGFRLGVRLSK